MSKIVNSDLAAGCVTNYQDIYMFDAAASAVAITEAYTSAVSFPISQVQNFLKDHPECDTLTIVPGVYTEEFANQYGTIPGRLSMFLYATKGKYGGGLGDPIPPDGDPLNQGELQP